MFLVVGLGNPGSAYEKTRHNVGFMVVEAFAKEYNLPSFHSHKKSNSLITQGTINHTNIVLAKPQTFMNNSGSTIKKLFGNWKLEIRNLIIIHDDIDLPLGTIRVSRARGSAGHKGVESIIKQLGTKDFTRIRVGIQPKHGKPKSVETFVLKKFVTQEQAALDHAIQHSLGTLKAEVEGRG